MRYIHRQGINQGLRKILSKMGISSIASYRGAQLFEAVGLHPEVIDMCGTGTPSRIGGAGFAELEAEQAELSRQAWRPQAPLSAGGLLKYVHGGEYHAFNPDVVQALHQAVASDDPERYRRYAQLVNQRPPTALRDLLRLRPAAPGFSTQGRPCWSMHSRAAPVAPRILIGFSSQFRSRPAFQ